MNIGKPSSNFIQMPWMKRQETDESRQKAEQNKELRLPGIGFLPNKVRNHFIAMVGEFIGTFLFLFFAFAATQVANAGAAAATAGHAQTAGDSLAQAPDSSSLMYISLAFGFSLGVNVWVFFRVSGGEWDGYVRHVESKLTSSTRSFQPSCHTRAGHDWRHHLDPRWPCLHR